MLSVPRLAQVLRKGGCGSKLQIHRQKYRTGVLQTSRSCVIFPATMHTSAAGLIRLVLIGDVHGAWDPEHDAAALEFLQPDAAIFVGDFGEEAISLVKQIAEVAVPKAVILGNHDAWNAMYLSQGPEGVIQQLDILGEDHVGYSAKHFKAASGQAFSVVGARPFTDGNGTISKTTRQFYKVSTMAESGDKVYQELIRQPAEDPVIVVGHNGPQGLGDRRHDPCGKDFRPTEGDYGDADLRLALDAAHEAGRSIALVTFGHMHQALHPRYGRGQRNMVHIDEKTGTVFLNCAVVPRHMDLPGAGGEVASHFVEVTLDGNAVVAARNLWLRASRAGKFEILKAEELLKSLPAPHDGLDRSCYQKFSDKWSDKVLRRDVQPVQEQHAAEL